MLQVPRVVNVVLANSSRSFSALTSALYSSCSPTKIKEAPILDNACVVASPEETRMRNNLESTIFVPAMVNLTPVNGFPAEYIRTRRVRIFQPAKNAMQSGTTNIQHWELEFDNKQRWENPLMGWTANADPMTCLKLKFTGMCEAVEYCEKNGWMYFIDVPRLERGFRVQNTNFNFSWNKRTRVSTK